MNHNIQIIDDDEKLCIALKKFLKDFGFSVFYSLSGDDGVKQVRSKKPDLIILDIMLPGMNGFEVCKKIRQEYTIPIIMLTARGEVTDKIVGLEVGADDYLAKPFEPRELVARIQAILRRTRKKVNAENIQIGKLNIDFQKHQAYIDGNLLDLTTYEFDILSLLIRNPGKVLSRDLILEELRGMECNAFNRSIDIAISRLRTKLNDDPDKPFYIKTIWGAGYVFIGGEVK